MDVIPRKVAIVGGGIVGLATAYRLEQKFPDANVTVLEKEAAVGQHQSTHNSGVLHAGTYYAPGSARARLAVRGIRQMVEFCQQNAIPHDICGKLIVASHESEVSRLQSLLERGQKNGLTGLRILNTTEMKEIEPHVGGTAALHVPEEGIVDYGKVCTTLASKIQGKIVTNAALRRLRRTPGGWIATTSNGEFECNLLINCAGLQCDLVSELAGMKRDLRIVPFRGEYYNIKPERQYLVRNLIYPVADPRLPFLGVHFTRSIRGGIKAGPNAVLAFAREGYRKSDVKLGDIADALTYPGLWKFLKKYPRVCAEELRRSFSKKLFCKSLQKLVPEITEDDLEADGSGVRAQALSPTGEILQDFEVRRAPNAIHVLSAPSPAATASLAIGQEIVDRFISSD